MTRHIATTELKARLSEILGDVERGETVSVTRHGKAIARIVPDYTDDRRERARRAIEKLQEFRESLPKTGTTIEEILEWRHEGHKY